VTQTEKLSNAVMEVVMGTFNRPGSGWPAVRTRVEAAIAKELSPPAPLAASLAETEAALGDKRLYTTHDVGRLLQMDASTISKWIDSGKLTAFRTPGGHRRVRAQDLKAFCSSRGIPITGELEAA
jgi:excisionase family DNA binding protein